ncbi:Low-density lipoprotein receptor-related protein 2 [Chionoecetes opilio]|uniref:Low-density lipoprotein receptor-related protein 2 n=1 Tax=Chionoecetes opilio TaxID=41210 RepID=A0A8J5CWA2_CHIOP|nr:Low-density lipoprotein receptor-related protein 2 [Chionoecetes opilio]
MPRGHPMRFAGAHSACIQGYCRPAGTGFVATGEQLSQGCLVGCHVQESGAVPPGDAWLLLPLHSTKSDGLLGSPCGTTAQCSKHVPGAVCVIQPPPATPPEDLPPHSITAIPGVPQRPLGVPLALCVCPPGHLAAENGTRCIPVLKDVGVTPASLGQRCDGSGQCRASDPFTHCLRGVCHCLHDTRACSARTPGCHPKTFQCISSGRCISWFFLCDGVRHCEDGSDEDTCTPHRCPPLAHTCRDGTCVSRARLCDGRPDCMDGSDERQCDGGEDLLLIC